MAQWREVTSRRNQLLLLLPLVVIVVALQITYRSGHGALYVVEPETSTKAVLTDNPSANKSQAISLSSSSSSSNISSSSPWLDQAAWLNKRQELQSQGHAAKVYMFAYMRGGSSLGGMLFDKDPAGVLWYEPLDQFFMAYYGATRWGLPIDMCYHPNGTRRHIPELEQQLYVDYISNLLTCNYESLPAETMTHTDFITQSKAMRFMSTCLRNVVTNACKTPIKDYCGSGPKHGRDLALAWQRKCPQLIQLMNELKPQGYSLELDRTVRERLGLQGQKVNIQNFVQHYECVAKTEPRLKQCVPKAVEKCRKARVHAVEVLRSNMEALEGLLQRLPDMHVVYYVRDPRAIANSVKSTKLRTVLTSSLLDEAKTVCHKMLEDIAHYKRLDQKYPGAFITVKYEELVTDPAGFGNRVYQHLGLGQATKEWGAFADQALHAKSGGGTFGVMRKDGSASIDKWRNGLTPAYIEQVNDVCRDALTQLHYDV